MKSINVNLINCVRKFCTEVESKKKLAPPGFWNDKKNHRIFLEQLGEKLGFNSWEDWYKVKKTDITQNGGSKLFRLYGESLIKTISNVFDDKNWRSWLFENEKVPSGFWLNKQNQKEYLIYLADKLRIKSYNDWFSIKNETILNHRGHGLLRAYNYSLSNALNSTFPEHNWPTFQRDIYQSHWFSIERQREFFTKISKQLEIKNFEDWYRVKAQDIIKLGGEAILNLYGRSHISAIISIFPEHPWKIYYFEHLPQRFYKNEENVKQVLNELERELKITKMEDWYGVSHSQIISFGYISILHECRGLFELLSKFYPEFSWDKTRFRFYKTQQFLYQTLRELFPKMDIFMNYPHPDTETGNKVELDVFIPEFSLAFEYQGERHYFDNSLHGVLDYSKVCDSEKLKFCAKHDITLIQIPFWWNFSSESLLATIHKYRSDVVQDKQIPLHWFPIPENIDDFNSKKKGLK